MLRKPAPSSAALPARSAPAPLMRQHTRPGRQAAQTSAGWCIMSCVQVPWKAAFCRCLQDPVDGVLSAQQAFVQAGHMSASSALTAARRGGLELAPPHKKQHARLAGHCCVAERE